MGRETDTERERERQARLFTHKQDSGLFRSLNTEHVLMEVGGRMVRPDGLKRLRR